MCELIEYKSSTHHFFRDENGNKQGAYILWRENGQLWEYTNYLDGKRHGVHKDWYRSGQLWEYSFFINGLRHGEYKSWHSGGDIFSHSIYVNGYITSIQIPTCEEDKFLLCLEHGQMQFLEE